MNQQLASFAARLRGLIDLQPFPADEATFESLALELFALQFQHNPAYQKICAAWRLTPENVRSWTQIPAVPTGAFKELELSSIAPASRTAVFHSSGTTEQKPSRHFHCPESLSVYESSLWQWFKGHVSTQQPFIFLTPAPAAVPHSSLVHMFETVQTKAAETGCAAASAKFFGGIGADGAWTMDFAAVVQTLNAACASGKPVTLLGTAFSFVHLLDFLAENRVRLKLPAQSQVMETGGYKNRSRTLPKNELHALITEYLGVRRENIICEYGMSELSSQAYDSGGSSRAFHFPPWARVQIISPETSKPVAEGETGLVRILDLANVFSVAAIQTEDLGIRRGDGFELAGRAQLAEPRGCSLMTA